MIIILICCLVVVICGFYYLIYRIIKKGKLQEQYNQERQEHMIKYHGWRRMYSYPFFIIPPPPKNRATLFDTSCQIHHPNDCKIICSKCHQKLPV